MPIPENQHPLDLIKGLGSVILAGGQSSRLGRDKTELRFNDGVTGEATFLEHVCRRVSQVTHPVVIVGPVKADTHLLPDHVQIVSDERPDSGPLEGIRVGLQHLSDQCDLAFVTSCDVPMLRPEVIRYLHEHLGTADAIVPIQGERIFGMTAIYQTSAHQLADARIKAGQLRVSELARACQAKMIDVEKLRSVDPDFDSLMNVNSLADLEALLRRAQQSTEHSPWKSL